MKGGCDEKGIATQTGDTGFAENMHVRGSVEKTLPLPNGVLPRSRIVVAGQDIDVQRGVGGKKADDGCDEVFVHLVVLKQVTRDEEGVGLPVDGQLKGPPEGFKTDLAEPRTKDPELGKTSSQLPISGVDETDHAVQG